MEFFLNIFSASRNRTKLSVEAFRTQNDRLLQHRKERLREILKKDLRRKFEVLKIQIDNDKLEGIINGKSYQVLSSGEGTGGCIYDSNEDDDAKKVVEILERTSDKSFLLIGIPSEFYPERYTREQEAKIRSTQYARFLEIYPELYKSEENVKKINVFDADNLYKQTNLFLLDENDLSYQKVIFLNAHGLSGKIVFKNGQDTIPIDKYCSFIQEQMRKIVQFGSPDVLIVFTQCYGHTFDPKFNKSDSNMCVISLSNSETPCVEYDVYDLTDLCESDHLKLNEFGRRLREHTKFAVTPSNGRSLCCLQICDLVLTCLRNTSCCRIRDFLFRCLREKRNTNQSPDDVPLLEDI